MSVGLLVRLALSAAALGWLAWTFPLGASAEAMAQAALPWVLAALLLKALAVPASALVWRSVLPPDLRPRPGSAARTYFASLHAGLVGPGNLVGDAFRLGQVGGLRRADAGLAGLVGERALTLAAMAGAAALGTWLSPEAAGWRAPLTAFALLAWGGVVLGLVAGPRLERRLRGPGFPSRALRAGAAAFADLRAPRAAAPALLAAWSLPLLTAASTWCLFAAVGWRLDPGFTLFASNAAAMVVMLPLSVQGLGVREGAFVLLFSGLAGVPPTLALAASLLSLVTGVALGLLAGAALWGPKLKPRRAPAAAPRQPGTLALLPLMMAPMLAANSFGSVGEAFDRLLRMLRELLSGLAKEMEYLPPGSAPLVMIFGGLFVLALSLVLSLMGPHLAALAGGARPAPAAPWPGPAAASSAMQAGLPPLPANLVTPPAGAGRGHEEGLAVGKALSLGDLDAVLDAAERMGLGVTHLVSVEPHRQVVRFVGCQTCRLRPEMGKGPGCGFEQGFLEGAVRGFAPKGSVGEVFCSKASDGACEFEIRTGW